MNSKKSIKKTVVMMMGQYDINEFLKKNKPKWFTRSQIQQGIDGSRASVIASLARMRKREEVNFKEVRVQCKNNSRDIPHYSYKDY